MVVNYFLKNIYWSIQYNYLYIQKKYATFLEQKLFLVSCPSSGEMLVKMGDLFPFENPPVPQIASCGKSSDNFLQFVSYFHGNHLK